MISCPALRPIQVVPLNKRHLLAGAEQLVGNFLTFREAIGQPGGLAGRGRVPGIGLPSIHGGGTSVVETTVRLPSIRI